MAQEIMRPNFGPVQSPGPGHPVRIAPIQQRVLTPVPGPPAQARAVPNAMGTIGRGLDAMGEQVARIGAIQQEHQNALDMGEAADAYREGQAQIWADTLQQPGMKMPGYFRQQTGDLIKRISQNPKYAAIAPQIGAHLRELQSASLAQVIKRSAVATMKEQVGQLANQITATAQTAAADYTTSAAKDGSVSFADAADAEAARGRIFGRIDALFPSHANPEENAALKRQYDQTVMLHRAEYIALNKPGQLLDFLHANQDSLTPSQVKSLRSDMISALTFRQRAIDASVKQQKSELESEIIQLSADGRPIGAKLQELGQRFGNTPLYQMLSGHPYRADLPSEPGLTKQFNQQIADAASSTDLQGVTENIKWATVSGGLNSKDASALMLMARDRAQSLQHGDNAVKAQWKLKALQHWRPAETRIQREMDSFGKAQIPRAQFDLIWTSAINRHPNDPQAAYKETVKELDDIQRNASPRVPAAIRFSGLIKKGATAK